MDLSTFSLAGPPCRSAERVKRVEIDGEEAQVSIVLQLRWKFSTKTWIQQRFLVALVLWLIGHLSPRHSERGLGS